MLLNLDRARDVMEREGLDGLVAATPLNAYYLSGYQGALYNVQHFEATYFAVLPRRASAPASLVLPAFEIRRLVSAGGTWMPQVIAATGPGDDAVGGAEGRSRSMAYAGWPIRAGAPLTAREKAWVASATQVDANRAADSVQGLSQALRSAGLDRAVLGVDDSRVAGWLAAAGLSSVRVHSDTGHFNRIRLVKTAAEISLLRTAAQLNEAAMLFAIEQLREGSTWTDIENHYMAAIAQRGGRGIYLMCGVGGLPAVTVRQHEPIMFDALGTFAGYHGDFGRCAVLGLPSRELERRHAALVAGWRVAQDYLRPGVRYSELSAAVTQAVHRAGFPEFPRAIPHSLGLEHNDDPKAAGAVPGIKPDALLEENMVINVDMPYTEVGWGSVHVEDTVRITADGCEALTSCDLKLRQVGS